LITPGFVANADRLALEFLSPRGNQSSNSCHSGERIGLRGVSSSRHRASCEENNQARDCVRAISSLFCSSPREKGLGGQIKKNFMCEGCTRNAEGSTRSAEGSSRKALPRSVLELRPQPSPGLTVENTYLRFRPRLFMVWFGGEYRTLICPSGTLFLRLDDFQMLLAMTSKAGSLKLMTSMIQSGIPVPLFILKPRVLRAGSPPFVRYGPIPDVLSRLATRFQYFNPLVALY
jgi:hypothetical protein